MWMVPISQPVPHHETASVAKRLVVPRGPRQEAIDKVQKFGKRPTSCPDLHVFDPNWVPALTQSPFNSLAPTVRHPAFPASDLSALAHSLDSLAVSHLKSFKHGLAREADRQRDAYNAKRGVCSREEACTSRARLKITEPCMRSINKRRNVQRSAANRSSQWRLA